MTNKKGTDIKIRPAIEGDIKGILAVQKDLLLGNLNDKEARRKGFLVYPVTEDELKKIIKNKSNILLVAERKEGIVGYALTYDLNEWRKNKPKWDKGVMADNTAKSHLLHDKVLYFRHIARKQDSSGVGSRLEEEVYNLAQNQGYRTVIGEVLEKPTPNEMSQEIHVKRGFRKIGQVDYKDGKLWGLYKKELKPRGGRGLDTTLGLVPIISFLVSIFFLSSNITGNVIGNLTNSTSNVIGVIFLLVGLVGSFFYFRNRKI